MQEGGENYRQALFGQLKGLSKEARRKELDRAKQDPNYWSNRNQKIEEEQNEVPINEGMGIYIKYKTLYHGSPHKGIDTFRPAEEITIGKGVYLTSQTRDAISYAKVRNLYKTDPNFVLYEVSISDMKFIDLRNAINVKKVFQGFRPIIVETKAKIKPTGNNYFDKTVQGMLDEKIRLIGEDKIDDTNILEITRNMGEAFTEYVKTLGYDGVLAWEGGEGSEFSGRDHDTYVVFDPKRVHINQEQDIDIAA